MGNEIKFEDAFGKLEIIVKKLEEGNLNLEESMRLFEEGINLSKVCASKLEEAEKKVEILIKGENGATGIKPFEKFINEETDE